MTLVWLLSGVNQLVALQMFQQSELFATLLALVFFNTSVDQLMALQGVVADKRLATFVTFELL